MFIRRMPRPHARTSRTRLLAVGAATSALLLAGQPASAATEGRPNVKARQAGITEPGQAYMGWHQATDSPTSTRATEPAPDAASVEGMDVSGWQGSVNWKSWWDKGKRFAYVKATEGTGYRSDTFTQQYNGSYKVGMVRGAYHFATPNTDSGAAEARYFVKHGGNWSKDGKTLPGVLDIEYNPYEGNDCYNLSASKMVAWIGDFTKTYKSLTGRDAVIYTTLDWWRTCTGNTTKFSKTNPLWIARWASSPGTMPGGWSYQTFWQYTDKPIDQDRFNGSMNRLKALASG